MVLQKLKKIFEPISMIMIIIGIIGLIQPIGIGIFRLGFIGIFRLGFNVLWVGLVAYILFSHFPGS